MKVVDKWVIDVTQNNNSSIAAQTSCLPCVYDITIRPFKPFVEELTKNLVAPFFNTGCVQFPDMTEIRFTVAGGVIRNYLDSNNVRYQKASNTDSVSDIDIYLLNGIESLTLDPLNSEARFVKNNRFTFTNPTTGDITEYTTLTFIFKETKIQLIDYRTMVDSVTLVPTNTIDIIDSFDFVCCMAGIEYRYILPYLPTDQSGVQLSTIICKDIVYHPEFMLATSNKLLLLNKKCTTPMSLQRYSKYIHDYGYTVPEEEYEQLRVLLGIPEGYGKEYAE